MALHGLVSVTIGVPNVADVATYYEDFGLSSRGDNVFATVDGGDQLRLVHAPRRRLVEAVFGADHSDDLAKAAAALGRLGISTTIQVAGLSSVEPATGTIVRLTVRPRTKQNASKSPVYNGPGRIERVNARADGVLRTSRVRPRRLGHLVLGTPQFETTASFFRDGLGFKVSDQVRDVGVFLRCSTDHHNILVQRAPVPFLHHTSWQVDDIDEVGRGAMRMLETDPQRHVWGLGRHHAGSNFFWYLKDPAGNFSEYYSDMDSIPEDALWTPQTLEGARGMFNWGPPPPASFIHPEDLAELMTSSHA